MTIKQITDARREACWVIGDTMTDAELYARYGAGWRVYRRPQDGGQ